MYHTDCIGRDMGGKSALAIAMSIISAQPSSFFEVPLGDNGELNVRSRNS